MIGATGLPRGLAGVLDVTREQHRQHADVRPDWRTLLLVLTFVDAIALSIASAAAGLLRLELDAVLPVVSLGETDRHLVASVLVVPVLLVLFRLHGLYEPDRIFAGTREYGQIAHAATYGVLITLGLSYFAGGSPLVSRSWLLLVWIMTVSLVGVSRFATRRVVRWLRARGALRTRVVIVGASTFGVAIAEQLHTAAGEGIDVAGFLDEYLPIGQPLFGDIRVIGRPGDLMRGRPAHAADEYVLIPQALPYERLEEMSRFMASQEKVVVRMAVSSNDLLTNGVRVAERGSIPLITLRRARLGRLEGVLKGSLELSVCAAALLVLMPFAIAAFIRGLIADRRPLLTRTAIHTVGGARTTLWLFNEQVVSWQPLRGMPALLGVLSGRLSLVGPRPIPCSASEPESPPIGLTAVKPGLTGPWRLSGPAASLADQALQDLTYVRNYSIWEDVRILVESMRRLPRAELTDLLGRWHSPETGELPLQPTPLAQRVSSGL